MNNENYINILGWMINDLNLKGNELILYAIIYGFSQDGQSEYYGSQRYISKALKVSLVTSNKIINKLLESTKFGEIPTILIEDESRKIVGEIEQNVVSQGGKFEDYLSSLGKTKEQLLEEVKEEAEKRVKIALLIREIGVKEGVRASKEEVDNVLEIIEETCQTRKEYTMTSSMIGETSSFMGQPIEVSVGGATVFVLDVDQFIKF
jgi:hypothetical protein